MTPTQKLIEDLDQTWECMECGGISHETVETKIHAALPEILEDFYRWLDDEAMIRYHGKEQPYADELVAAYLAPEENE